MKNEKEDNRPKKGNIKAKKKKQKKGVLLSDYQEGNTDDLAFVYEVRDEVVYANGILKARIFEKFKLIGVKERYRFFKRYYFLNIQKRGIVEDMIKFMRMTRSKVIKSDGQTYRLKNVNENLMYKNQMQNLLDSFKNFYTNKKFIKNENERIMNDLMFGKIKLNKIGRDKKIELLNNPRYNPLKWKEELIASGSKEWKNIYLTKEELPEYVKHLIMKMALEKDENHPHIKIGKTENFGIYITTSTVRSTNIEEKVIMDVKKGSSFLHKTLLPRIENKTVTGGDRNVVGLLYKPEKESVQYVSNIIRMENNEKINGVWEKSERIEYISKVHGIESTKAEILVENAGEEVVVYLEKGEMDSIKIKTERGVIIDAEKFKDLWSVRNNVVEMVNRVINNDLVSKYELKVLIQDVIILDNVLKKGGKEAELLWEATPELKWIRDKFKNMTAEEQKALLNFGSEESIISEPWKNMYLIEHKDSLLAIE